MWLQTTGRSGQEATPHRVVLEGADAEAAQQALLIAVRLLRHAAPQHLNFGVCQRPALHDLAGPELVPPVQDVHLQRS